MMHCSYQLSPLAISKRACFKSHTEAYPEGFPVKNPFNFIPKKNLYICPDCPIRKRLAFLYPVDSSMTPLV